jgi:hypothetical protein
LDGEKNQRTALAEYGRKGKRYGVPGAPESAARPNAAQAEAT